MINHASLFKSEALPLVATALKLEASTFQANAVLISPIVLSIAATSSFKSDMSAALHPSLSCKSAIASA